MQLKQTPKDMWYFLVAIREGNYLPQKFLQEFPRGLILTTQPGDTYVIDPDGTITSPMNQRPFQLNGAQLVSLGSVPHDRANDISSLLSETNPENTLDVVNSQRDIGKTLNFIGRKPRIDGKLRLVATVSEGQALKYHTPAYVFEPLTKILPLV